MNIEKIIEEQLDKNKDYNELIQLVSLHISQLIEKDFMQFIQLLYWLDIDEKHLHESEIIDTEHLAEIIVQRELQKIEFKKKFSRNNNISDDEAW